MSEVLPLSHVKHLRPQPERVRLLDERQAKTHHFVIYANLCEEVVEVDGYVTVGMYEDGSPGEVFIRMGKEHGSTIQGFADGWAIGVSWLLQVGVPLRTITSKFRHVRFEPSGRTNCSKVPSCSSLIDYVSAWLEQEFPEHEET